MADQVKNIHQRLAAITGAVGSVQKTGKNLEQKYDYIEYDAVTAALRGLMAEHGITVLQNMKEGGRYESEITSKYGAKGIHLLIDYIFTVTNVDDPTDKLEFLWQGEASDYGDKATNKCATAAEKYFLLKLFKIGTKDDADAETTEAAAKTPVEQNTSSSQAERQLAANWEINNIKIAARKVTGLTDDTELTNWIEDTLNWPLDKLPKLKVQAAIEKINSAHTNQNGSPQED